MNGHQNEAFSCLIGALNSPRKVNGYGADYATARHISKCTEFGTIKIGVVEHFSFTKVLNCTFQTEPTENDVLLQLTTSHIGQRNIVIVIVRNDGYLRILDINLCHR